MAGTGSSPNRGFPSKVVGLLWLPAVTEVPAQEIAPYHDCFQP